MYYIPWTFDHLDGLGGRRLNLQLLVYMFAKQLAKAKRNRSKPHTQCHPKVAPLLELAEDEVEAEPIPTNPSRGLNFLNLWASVDATVDFDDMVLT